MPHFPVRFVKLLHIILWVLLWGMPVVGFSQTYPVHATVQLIPPYSLYVSDYYSLSREKLVVTLLNRDLARPSLEVRLRLSITSQGATIMTKDLPTLPRLTLEPGVPLRISGEDLRPFLSRENLAGYLSQGRLPEGPATFSVEVFEAYTQRLVSGKVSTTVWLSFSKPPQLNLPANNETIVFRDPTTILFQWVPQHRGISQVDYEFVLKELPANSNVPPQSAFAYSPEIYRDVFHQTSLPYNSALYAPLQADRTYAWQVRARARDGIDEINLFENNGYSEIRWFTLEEPCDLPVNLNYTTRYNKVNLHWSGGSILNMGYEVQYREQLPTLKDWTVTEQAMTPSATIGPMVMGRTYEARVGVQCPSGKTGYSEPIIIAMPEEDPIAAARCGQDPSNEPLNQERRYDLKEGDTFMASGCPMYVKHLTSNLNGVYSGEGTAGLPVFNVAEVTVGVIFENIEVNVDNQLVGGVIYSKYDATMQTLTDVDEIYEGGGGAGEIKTGATQIDYSVAYVIEGPDAFSYDKTTNTLTVVDDRGNTQTIPINTTDYRAGAGDKTGIEGGVASVFPMTIKDQSGTIYQVEEEMTTGEDGTPQPTGKVTATVVGKDRGELEKGLYNPKKVETTLATVTFSNTPNSRYAIDTLPDYFANTLLVAKAYEQLQPNYNVPYKFLPEGGGDEVQATITIKDQKIKPDEVVFRSPKGTQYDYTREGNTYKLQLTAGPVNDVQEIYAFHLDLGNQGSYVTLGKINVATYAKQEHKLTLVAVNGNTLNTKEVESYLNKVYNPVGVSWTVAQDEAFTYTLNTLNTEGSGLFSAYTPEMKALNAAYQTYKQDKIDGSSVYLFVLNSGEMKGRAMAGDMPRGKQFGYLFTQGQSTASLYRTIAHELGHGKWKLRHTFDSQLAPATEATTDNIMDYTAGAHLSKWQWDQLSDPAALVSIFEKDEAGMALLKLVVSENKKFISYSADITDIEKNYAFLLPSLAPVWIPNADSLFFDEFGTLNSFYIAGERYTAIFQEASLNINGAIFHGFYKETEFRALQKICDNPDIGVLADELNKLQAFNFTIAKKGDNVLSYKRTNTFRAECKQILTWQYEGTPPSVVKGRQKEAIIPANAKILLQTGDCSGINIAREADLKEGIGTDFYTLFTPSLPESERDNLLARCNELTDEVYNITGKNYRLTNSFGKWLKDEGITSLEEFESVYYMGFTHGIFVISKYDLWADLAPDYNRVNHYEYLPHELLIRYKYLESNNVFAQTILGYEKEGKPQPIDREAFIAKYGNSANLVAFMLYFGVEAEVINIDFGAQAVNRISSIFKTKKTGRFSLGAAKDKPIVKEGSTIEELTDITKTHVLKGEINKAGKAVGVHSHSAFRNGTARIRPGTTVTEGPDGLKRAYVDVKDANGNWIPKNAKSTLFPEHWSDEKILREIEHAFKNRVRQGDVFEGVSSEGIKIRMFLGENNTINTAFPIF